MLARIEAGQGREADCRAHAQRALEVAEALQTHSIRTMAAAALGLLDAGLGRPEAVSERLEPVERWSAAQGLAEPEVARSAPDLVEACIRTERLDRASDGLASLEAAAEHTDGSWTRAVAARCRGLMTAGDGFEPHFKTALDWHNQLDDPFERARTELCYGERLRRARRRGEAREWLHRALDTFESLGAAPWGQRAGRELSATGERAGRRSAAGASELTGQELQVALTVASGATNREAASALFLSPKTVEFHLGNVYRKLGLRSRTELAAILAGTSPDRLTP